MSNPYENKFSETVGKLTLERYLDLISVLAVLSVFIILHYSILMMHFGTLTSLDNSMYSLLETIVGSIFTLWLGIACIPPSWSICCTKVCNLHYRLKGQWYNLKAQDGIGQVQNVVPLLLYTALKQGKTNKNPRVLHTMLPDSGPDHFVLQRSTQ